MNKDSLIYVAGDGGLVGSAIVRCLQSNGYNNILVARHSEVDLTIQTEVCDFFGKFKPEYVFLAAARVGGIVANDSAPVEFLRDNLAIAVNVVEAAYRNEVKKLLFLGSSCIYPKNAPQPMPEDCLLAGSLEPTNQWYAIAKIAGLKLCQAYRRQYGFNAISAMPTNLYGPGDNFNLKTSHVLPALIRKFHEAKINRSPEVKIWGTGNARREFLHVDDLADACLFLMNEFNDELWINVGWGRDIRIEELAKLVANVVKYQGALRFDTNMPDGTPRKLLDTSRLVALGWRPQIELEHGIRVTYEWYLDHLNNLRG